ncbi:3-hydroxyanthranilate 3,4-dioxygenase [Neolecta irregularis DAH-3]|uniref:3-hydroxyanthranilate 3,4-dioxygenase n=1 Tax=Neolecta irregularis (strain DAH-3) TaxID=1198029 RepID=A0A1U7LIV1_NEOID|nr:3-hydroxyanthranilate 3,4-dioxygenase [Neolecta irregularis DAH-3]|eukprot:OLL22574.1 3-hydroxyanthranilate 3,4-dioxygenase [Neolecta irregularis DAH-3]
MLSQPLNIPEWLAENSHLLQPPIMNACVIRGEDSVMIVGGPNSRTDYHLNPTPEFFYQYKGNMILKVVDDNKFRDIPINEGDMFLLPSNTPHSPVRYANTVGIVVEQTRPQGENDHLLWYCSNPNCQKIVHDEQFYLVDLGTQIKAGVERFAASESLRKCKACETMVSVLPD